MVCEKIFLITANKNDFCTGCPTSVLRGGKAKFVDFFFKGAYLILKVNICLFFFPALLLFGINFNGSSRWIKLQSLFSSFYCGQTLYNIVLYYSLVFIVGIMIDFRGTVDSGFRIVGKPDSIFFF